MTLRHGESRSIFHIGLEELVREMLREESKHQAGALRVRNKLSPRQELLSQNLDVGQLLFTWKQQRQSF